MAFNFNDVLINNSIASGTNNYSFYSDKKVKDAVIKNSDFKSSVVNSLLYKTTSALNYIQSNGFISYIPNKPYSLNNTVSVIYNDNGILRSTLLRCMNVDSTGFCLTPPNRNYSIDNNGNVLFNDNNWDTNYWYELTKENLNSFKTKCQEFFIDYTTNNKSRSNNQLRSIELFDYTGITDVRYTNFSINTNRFNKLFFTCSLSGNSNKIKLEVKSVKNINNYSLFNNKIWYENSMFSDVALYGLFLSVDEVHKKVYLHYLADDITNDGIRTSFDINITLNKGSFNVSLAQIDNLNVIDNNDFVIVPIIKNASNDYSRKTLNIFDYAYNLNVKEIFSNGLYFINGEEVLDKWLYPIFRKSNSNKSTIYNLLGRYKHYVNGNTRYVESKFANITGVSASSVFTDKGLTGPFKLTNKVEYMNWGTTDIIFNYKMQDCCIDTAGSYGNSYSYSGGINWLYKTIDTNTGGTSEWKLRHNKLDINNFFNSDPNDEGRLTTASIKTIPYIKLW